MSVAGAWVALGATWAACAAATRDMRALGAHARRARLARGARGGLSRLAMCGAALVLLAFTTGTLLVVQKRLGQGKDARTSIERLLLGQGGTGILTRRDSPSRGGWTTGSGVPRERGRGDILAFVAVFTGFGRSSAGRRATLRATWFPSSRDALAKFEEKYSIAMRFAIGDADAGAQVGDTTAQKAEAALQAEIAAYGGFMRMHGVTERYSNLPHKSRTFFASAARHPLLSRARWLVKVDDDVYGASGSENGPGASTRGCPRCEARRVRLPAGCPCLILQSDISVCSARSHTSQPKRSVAPAHSCCGCGAAHLAGAHKTGRHLSPRQVQGIREKGAFA